MFRQGEPATNEGKLAFNSEYSFNDAAEFYSFGGYSKRRGETAAFYRASNASNNIAALNPNGYLPLIKGSLEDTSLVVGLRGLLAYDSALRPVGQLRQEPIRAQHRNHQHLPGSGHAAQVRQRHLSNDQKQVSLDLSREFDVGLLPYPVSVAFGGEYLRQGYEIEAGEPASYYQSGSSGLGGFREADAGSSSRHNWAQYLDLETNFTEELSASAAVRRSRDSSDFGSNVERLAVGALRFHPAGGLARAVFPTVSAHRPSAQQNFAFTSSRLIGSEIREAGTFPASRPGVAAPAWRRGPEGREIAQLQPRPGTGARR